MTRGPRRIALFTMLALASLCAPAQAKIYLVHYTTVATSPTDVIGVDSISDCTTGTGNPGHPIAVSHDRGATVSAGACVNTLGPVMLDPVDGAVYVFDRFSSPESNYEDHRHFLRRL